MLISCPDCARSYHVDADQVGEHGRVLICPKCGARWFCAGEHGFGGGPRLQLGAVVAEQRPDPLPTIPAWTFPPLGGIVRPIVASACIALVAVGAVSMRRTVVRLIPKAAPIYAALHLPVHVRGLEFSRIVSAQLPSADLTVSGQIRNLGTRRMTLPRVAFEIRDAKGAPLISWSETPPAPTLGAGRIVAFASLPHSVPPESRSVLVRFEDGQPSTP